jgi:hypothetical protein
MEPTFTSQFCATSVVKSEIFDPIIYLSDLNYILKLPSIALIYLSFNSGKLRVFIL